jgi:hypothetical protein
VAGLLCFSDDGAHDEPDDEKDDQDDEQFHWSEVEWHGVRELLVI